jgi:hypothetical protein
MKKLHYIHGITFDNDLYMFTIKLSRLRSKREMWPTIEDIDRKLH